MLSNLTVKLFTIYVNLLNSMFGLPFEWNSEKRRLKITTSKIRLIFWRLQQLWLVCYVTNLYIALYKSISSQEKQNPLTITINSFMAIGYSAVFACQINLIYKEEIADFVTQIFAFNQCRVDQEYLEDHPKRDGCELFIALILNISIFSTPPVLVGLFLWDPGQPRYLYNWFLSDTSQTTTTLVVWALVEGITTILGALGAFFYSPALVMYAHCCNSSLIRLLTQSDSKSSYNLVTKTNTNRASTSRQENLGIFGQLSILNILSNAALSRIVWPSGISAIVLLESIGIYGCVKLHDSVPPLLFPLFPLVAFMGLICQVVLFPLMGKMSFYSLVFIRSVRFPQAFTAVETSQSTDSMRIKVMVNKIDKKVANALRPLVTDVHGIFTIKRTTTLIMIVVVSNLTINFILLH